MKILLLDNHDSFTYNLAELLYRIGGSTVAVRTPEELALPEVKKYDKVIFSPGPGLPEEHPFMFRILEEFDIVKPFLGVCLGMQAMVVHFGGSLIQMTGIVHGKDQKLLVLHPEFYLFRNIPDHTAVGLYHSWAVNLAGFPDCLEITAVSSEGIVMAVHHKKYDLCGMQFHPESIITERGSLMLSNWINH